MAPTSATPPPSSSSSSSPTYTSFAEISGAALKRQNDVLEIINFVKWQEGNLFLLIPPTHHLVDSAFKVIKSVAKEKGLYTERHRLLKDEVESYIPKLTRQAGGYYVCIATSRLLAKASIEAERIRRKDIKQSVSSRKQEITKTIVSTTNISSASTLKKHQTSTPESNTHPIQRHSPQNDSSFLPINVVDDQIEALLQCKPTDIAHTINSPPVPEALQVEFDDTITAAALTSSPLSPLSPPLPLWNPSKECDFSTAATTAGSKRKLCFEKEIENEIG